MSLPEALWIVCQNKHGVAMSYWDTYLPAILMVNEAFPVEGYTAIEDDDTYFEDVEYLEWIQELNQQYDKRNQ